MATLRLRTLFFALPVALAACSGGGGTTSSGSALPQAATKTTASASTRAAVAALSTSPGSGAAIVQTAIAAPDSAGSTAVTVALAQTPKPGDVLAFGVWSSAANPTVAGPAGVSSGGAQDFGAGNGQTSIWFRRVQSGDGRTWSFTSNVASAIVVGAVELQNVVASGTPGYGTWSAVTGKTTGWAQSTFAATSAGELPIAFFFSSTGHVSWALSATSFGTPVLDQQVSTETNLSALILNAGLTTAPGTGTWWGAATASAPATGAEMSLYVLPAPTPSPSPTQTPSPSPTQTPSPSPTQTPSPSPTQTPSPSPTQTPSPSPTQTPSPRPSPTFPPVADSTQAPLYLDEDPNYVYGDTSMFGTIRGSVGYDPIDGIGCGSHESVATHYHVHVTVYVNEHQYAIAAGTGIYEPTVLYPPNFVYDSYPAQSYSCFYGIHVHALMGMIHIEMPAANAVGTLGEFFDIAGIQLAQTGLGSVSGPTRWFDTDETSGAAGSHPVTEMTATDPHLVPLLDHHEYTIEVGPAWRAIPNFTFSPDFH